MCDQDHFDKDRQEYERLGLVTRKQFGMMLGAGMAMMLPRVANAATVTESDVNIYRRLTARPIAISCILRAARLPAFSFGRTSSDCARHFARWGNGSPNRAIRCWW